MLNPLPREVAWWVRTHDSQALLRTRAVAREARAPPCVGLPGPRPNPPFREPGPGQGPQDPDRGGGPRPASFRPL